MELPDKIFFKIGEVSEIAGVKPYVLRYWETEFSIAPHKSGSGQRLYRRKDIERFLLIKRLLYSEGYTIAGARKHLSKAGRGGAEGEGAAVQPEVEPPEALLEEAVFGEGGSEEMTGQETTKAPDPAWLQSLREEVLAMQSLIRAARSFKI